MKVKDYHYTVKLEVTFTQREAKMLERYARNHYNGTCRAAASRVRDAPHSVNGFIAQVGMFPGSTHTWTWRQFDLAAKILELHTHSSPLVSKLFDDMKNAMRTIARRVETITVYTEH